MATGQQIVDLAKTRVGEPYILGSLVPKNDANYHGPWDCAEFVSWNVFQLTGELYGCLNNGGNPATADSYTGYWYRDAKALGKIVSINEAFATPGAALLRVAGNGIVGHIVISDGKGGTVEAHSHKDGVIESHVTGRRWDYGILVPWITYIANQIPNISEVNQKPAGMIYRLTSPMMEGMGVQHIQEALGLKVDGIYGNNTFLSVREFQNKHGLVPDGEVGPKTMALLNQSSPQ